MIGKNIRNIRLLHSIKQQELANALSVSRSTICDWERDKSNPSLELLKKMKEFFDVPYDDFFDDD
jgi:transcriptional regulator with XRE-family HTH domain